MLTNCRCDHVTRQEGIRIIVTVEITNKIKLRLNVRHGRTYGNMTICNIFYKN